MIGLVLAFLLSWTVHRVKAPGKMQFDKRKYIREQNLMKKREYEEKIKKLGQFANPPKESIKSKKTD